MQDWMGGGGMAQSKVLDLGCGTGYFSNVLAKEVGPKGKVLVNMDGEKALAGMYIAIQIVQNSK